MMSRSTHSSGMSAGASNDFGSPLIVSVVAIRRLQFNNYLPASAGSEAQADCVDPIARRSVEAITSS
jgi:hypothetical protein